MSTRAYVPANKQEPVLRTDGREVSLLVADEALNVTHARHAAGERVAGPHIHHQHTDAFYILEGELTFEIGAESETSRLALAILPRRIQG